MTIDRKIKAGTEIVINNVNKEKKRRIRNKLGFISAKQ